MTGLHLPFATDLGHARDDIARRPWGRKLAGLITSYLDAHSAYADFVGVRAALGALETLQPSDPNLAQTAHAQGERTGLDIRAHAFTAIVLYMRAAETGSNTRRPVGVRGWLTPEQLSWHERIKKLRNDCISHFGTGAQIGHGYWNAETVCLINRGGDDLDVLVPTVRANARAVDMNALNLLVDVVLPRCKLLVNERRQSLLMEIRKIQEPELREILSRHAFQPANYFAGDDPWAEFRRYLTGPSRTRYVPLHGLESEADSG